LDEENVHEQDPLKMLKYFLKIAAHSFNKYERYSESFNQIRGTCILWTISVNGRTKQIQYTLLTSLWGYINSDTVFVYLEPQALKNRLVALAQLREHSTGYTSRTELWEMGTRLLYKWQRKLSNRRSYQLSLIVTI
jgi:hypothetical protein